MNDGNTNDLSISSNVPITVDLQKIDFLIQDVNKASMDLNEKFNKINSIIVGTKDYYISASGDNVRNQFEEYYLNLSNIVQSIENYAYSLKNVKDNFENLTDSNSRRLSEAIDEIVSKIPKIDKE